MEATLPHVMNVENSEQPRRYLIGIDLGTTNSAMAFVDTAEKIWAVKDFPIPQLVGAGQVESRDVLPSFHYEAAENEFAAGALRLPWETAEHERAFVGAFARDHGAQVPGRLVTSAKSWLSHSGVDRTAGLLPWHGAADVQKFSPVEVSSRYLSHIRAAWDAAHPEHPLGQQDVVLAVPASFDEVARELTIQAAQARGWRASRWWKNRRRRSMRGSMRRGAHGTSRSARVRRFWSATSAGAPAISRSYG